MRVLMVCLGNICRSPSAEIVMRHLASHWVIDSAGTGAWHIGNPADERAQAEAKKRGYDMGQLRARQFGAEDFENFDIIYAMDQSNFSDIEAMRPDGNTTPVELFLGDAQVPDPYYDGRFADMFDLIEAGARRIVAMQDGGKDLT